MKNLNFPEPYNCMINDLERSINEAKANYLVALGLFCYSEIIGRHILKLRKQNNAGCFNKFVGEYMGYKKLIKRYGVKIYDWFRNGLCHEYYIKKGKQSGVFVCFDRKTSKQGIVVSKDQQRKFLVIKPYLRDFKKGLRKFLQEEDRI